MQRSIYHSAFAVSLAFLVMPLMLSACGVGQPEPKQGAWAHVPDEQKHTDHTPFFSEPFADGPAVTKACLECHKDASLEVMKTAHWTWLGEEVKMPGRDKPVRMGKKNVINNFCIGVSSNWAACTSCHAGYGWKDENFDFQDPQLVDCLVCHDRSGAYMKKAKGAGLPSPESDLLAAARSVARPGRSNCGSCHFRGGGGNAVKHGDLDDTLLNPSEWTDVHMGRHDFDCISCHKTEKHNIPGRSISVSVQDTNRVRCSDCHQGQVHGDKRLDAHTARLACQTCHIPAMAVGEPTKMTWDWSQAGQDLDIKDKHVYMKIKGRFTYAQGNKPEYGWYNETSSRYLLGDKMDPEKVTKIAYPLGERKDPKSKIWPFKVHRGKQPFDKKNNYFLVPNVHGKEGFWTIFDWSMALENGSRSTGLEFSGEYGFAPTEMYWPLSHMVATKDRALTCRECHGPRGRMDWQALGYEKDPLAQEPFEHEAIPLLDQDGEPVAQTGKPVSLNNTCSECHDPDDEDFQKAHLYHKGLVPDSLPAHRAKLLQDGPGQVEEQETNCLLCHLANADNKSRNETLNSDQKQWSLTATLGNTKLVSRGPDGWTYNAAGFGEEHEAQLALGKTGQQSCGACHGLVDEGANPLTTRPGQLENWVTEQTGQVFSGQRIKLSALDLENKDQLRKPWDVHAARLVDCSECHYSDELPARFKDQKPAAKLEAGKRRQCASCHTLADSHQWLPERDKHFAQVACESCHVPRLHMYARQLEDLTVVKADGQALVHYRGLDGGSLPQADQRISGYEPALLARAGQPLSPYNLIATYRWVYGKDGQPVPADKLRAAWLSAGKYRPEIIKAFDANGDSQIQAQELRLVGQEKVTLVSELLKKQGLADVRIAGSMRAQAIHHNMVGGGFARRDCLNCHEKKGEAALKARPVIELAPYVPAGVKADLTGSEKVPGQLNKDSDGRLMLSPAKPAERD